MCVRVIILVWFCTVHSRQKKKKTRTHYEFTARDSPPLVCLFFFFYALKLYYFSLFFFFLRHNVLFFEHAVYSAFAVEVTYCNGILRGLKKKFYCSQRVRTFIMETVLHVRFYDVRAGKKRKLRFSRRCLLFVSPRPVVSFSRGTELHVYNNVRPIPWGLRVVSGAHLMTSHNILLL